MKRTVSNLAVACVMKSAFEIGAVDVLGAVEAGFGALNVLEVFVNWPRDAIELPRVEDPRPGPVSYYSVFRS